MSAVESAAVCADEPVRLRAAPPIRHIAFQVYPFVLAPRDFPNSRAGRRLIGMMEERRGVFRELCGEILGCRESFAEIPAHLESADTPHWHNIYLPPLDGMILTALLKRQNPRLYVEIGSGSSTKFARKAIRDYGLQTRIISIDPEPRAEIDAICDEVVRAPFQDIGEQVLDLLSPGDVFFQDGSHHVFTNTDATVFFNEVAPMLPRGITYGIHDIFLPLDYPATWNGRYYNEQYVWTSYLLAGACGHDILFPAYFAGMDAELSGSLDDVFALPALAGLQRLGGAFWMQS